MSSLATMNIPSPAIETRRSHPGRGRLISEEVYWEKYYEAETSYEWNEGRLEKKPVSDYQTYLVYHWFVNLLEHYLTGLPIARMVGLEMGFRLCLPRKTVIRKPDLGVVRNDNRVILKPLDRQYFGIFDLCVEALSDSKPGEILRDTVQKKSEYESGGVKEYFILHHEARHQAFYGLNSQGVYEPLPASKGIIRSGVLPGFQFRIKDLSNRPQIEEMLADEVYRGFVLPAWQQDRLRAEQAEKRAERQAARAEREAEARRVAEAEVVRLKAMLAGK